MDVILKTHVAVVDGAGPRGSATLTGHVDLVLSCRPYPAGTSGSCARQHRVGTVRVVRILESGTVRRSRTRSRARVVSDSTRRARLRIPVGPIRCTGVDDGFRLFFSVPLIEVGSGAPPEIFTPEARGFGCTVTGRRSSRSSALRRARDAFSARFRGTVDAGVRAFVDCQDESDARIRWQCVRRVPTGSDRRGPSRCWRLSVTRVSPNRFGRLERASFVRVSPVSRASRVRFANLCRPMT